MILPIEEHIIMEEMWLAYQIAFLTIMLNEERNLWTGQKKQ